MGKLYSGTSAYKIDEYEQYAYAHEEKRAQRKTQRKKETAAFCRFLTFAVIAVFLGASALVYTNVMMIRASSQVEKLENELALITEQNNQKKIEIEQKLDMKLIEEKAINELGMQRPENSQIVYVGVTQGTYMEKSAQTSGGGGLMNSIKDAFEGVLEYFAQ